MAQKTITVRIPETAFWSDGPVKTNFDIRKKLKDEGIPVSYNLNRNRMVVDYGKLEYCFDYVTGEAIYTWIGEVYEEPKQDFTKHERKELFELLKQTIPHLQHRYSYLQMCLVIADLRSLQMEYQQVKALIVQIKAVVNNFSREEGEKQ